jgi:outer membrane protein OmpA-like peptidoglycan-associated protein
VNLRSLFAISSGALPGVTLLLFAPSTIAADELGNEHLPAEVGDFALKIEPGVAFPLTEPQSELFQVGGGETIKALWTLKPYFDVGPSATYLALPRETALGDFGTAWAFGAGVRLKRPHHAPDNDAFHAISPWADADALYVRTGELNRPGFALAAGLSIPVGEARGFWIGPFARYLHILQGERTGFDDADAKILSLGISLEVGSGVERKRETIAVERVRTVEKVTTICPDRDRDGVLDSVDRCPDVAGLVEDQGCPPYQKVVVKRDKLELKEKLYFAWDDAVLEEDSFPVLDEVALALNDNKGFRVQIEGHASSEGTDDHNQTLSEARAEAVRAYLVAHGIDKERLVSKGFSSSVPIDTNATSAGRENNRRVEFVVYFIILDDGTN